MNASCQISSPLPETLRMPPARVELRAPRALIIDDDVALRPFFRRALNSVDPRFRMAWAASVDAGLTIIRRERPSFVVIDYLLEDGSGIAVKRWLDMFRPDLPYAMISALPVCDEINVGSPRVARFLAKPFTLADLSTLLVELRNARLPLRASARTRLLEGPATLKLRGDPDSARDKARIP